MNKRQLFLWLLGIALVGCFGGGLIGCNTGSETGNPTKGLTGTVKTLDGLPAAHTQVILVPKDFNPLDLVSGNSAALYLDTTDSKGQYHFSRVDSGRYNLEAISLTNGTRLRIMDIPIEGSVVSIPVQTLRISGKISAPLAGASDTVTGYVYVLGTTLYKKVMAANGTVAFDSVPAGRLDSLIYGNPQGSIPPKTFAWNLEVLPEASVIASGPYLAWKYSGVAFVNTASTGVKIAAKVAHMPLRLSLNATNFDFNKARMDGSDIRATNEKGEALPCELQLWDAGSKSGQVWILVDTVFSDSMQRLRLYWGYDGAGTLGTSWPTGSVLTTSDGYVAAWHLDEDPSVLGQAMTDWSGSKNNGIALGYQDSLGVPLAGGTSPSTIQGIIGTGMVFDGKSQFMGSRRAFKNPNTFTYSGWFKTTSLSGGRLFDFTDADTATKPTYWDRLIHMYADGTVHFGVYPPLIPGTPMPTTSTYKILHGTAALNDGQWHHVAARLSSQGQTFFVDGQRIANDATTIEAENVTGYWRLGFGHLSLWAPAGTNTYFQGAIDEVWIAHAERSDDFIKLNFENQKVGTRLLLFP
jgi:hypothetical protein